MCTARWADNDNVNNSGGTTTDAKGLVLRIKAWADGKMRKYHTRVVALKWPQKAAASAPETVAHQKRRVVTIFQPPQQWRNILKETALVGGSVDNSFEAQT